MAISALKPQFITTAKTKEGNDYKKSSIAAKTGALAGAVYGGLQYKNASKVLKDVFAENGVVDNEIRDVLKNLPNFFGPEQNAELIEESLQIGKKFGKKRTKGALVVAGLILTGVGFLAGKLVDFAINKHNAKSADKAAKAAENN